jgi:flagellar motor switch protein FliM
LDAASDVAPDGGDAASGLRLYDFRRPTKLSRDHTRVLEIAFDTFARQWTTLLTTTLRAVSSVRLRAIQHLTYDEYVSALPTPATIMVITVDPIAGVALLQTALSATMTIVDHLLGGPGTPPQPQRPLTEIESTLVTGLTERTLSELRYALESLVEIEASITGIEHNPQFVQAAAPSDLVIVASFDLRVGRDESVATLCMPFNGVFPYVERSLMGASVGRERADRQASARAVASRLSEAPVSVSVTLGATRVRMSDIVGLRLGDVVRLRHALDQPFEVMSAGTTFAYAVPGSEGTQAACLIVNPPEVSP